MSPSAASRSSRQYLSGTMEQVELSAPELDVEGMPIAVDVVAEGVPVDLASPVGHLTATIEADAAAVNRSSAPGRAGRRGRSGVRRRHRRLHRLGPRSSASPSSTRVTARPTAAGDTVLLEPVGVEVVAGGGSLDVSGIVDRLLGDDPFPCASPSTSPRASRCSRSRSSRRARPSPSRRTASGSTRRASPRIGTCD